MASLPIRRITPEEYLALERVADLKSEYIAGEVVAMAGGTRRHSLIKTNIEGLLWFALKRHPCEVHGGDLRVQAAGAYFYPDIVVCCGQPSFADDIHPDTLLNPAAVIEILSKTTECYDRDLKFMRYAQIESLTDFILVSQDDCRVEHFKRLADGQWPTPTILESPESRLDITSVRVSIPLTDIYDRVAFD